MLLRPSRPATSHRATSTRGECNGRDRAFTLIELLVVIGILTVLTAILFPVFSQVRESSRRAACVANMKQLGMALLQYSQDNTECFPSETIRLSFVNDKGVLVTITAPSNEGWAGRLYPYVKNTDLYHCPDDATQAKADSTGHPSVPVSYGLNANMRQRTQQAALQAPSRTVLLFEVVGDHAQISHPTEDAAALNPEDTLSATGDGTWEGLTAIYEPSLSSTDVKVAGPVHYATGKNDNFTATSSLDEDISAGARHRGGANYLLADGHVQYLMPLAVSAGGNANTPVGAQAVTGCYANPHATRAWACAEGTGVGTHQLTYSLR